MTAYDAVLNVKAIAVSSGMARSLRTHHQRAIWSVGCGQ